MLNHLLIVDDDPDDVEFFQNALADLLPEAQVSAFSTAEAAIEFLITCPQISYPELILLDFNLPVLNGWEGLREIKQTMAIRHVPVVMCSSADLSAQGVTASDVGAAAFMRKVDAMDVLKANLNDLFQTLFPERFYVATSKD
jgi:CheY-like chemotaxis protein